MKNIWNILCSNAIIDKASNNMTLVNIIEDITIQGEPGTEKLIPLRLDLISFWHRDDFDVSEAIGFSKTTLVSPSGMTIGTWNQHINLFDHGRNRSILQFVNLPINESGIYRFIVESQSPQTEEWINVGESILQVKFLQPDTSEEE